MFARTGPHHPATVTTPTRGRGHRSCQSGYTRVTLLAAFVLACVSASPPGNRRPIAIVTAVRSESKPLEQRIEGAVEETHEGYRFVTGRIGPRAVVLCNTGLGKVNAAAATTLLLEHYKPSAVIVVGVAGALNPDFQPGDIVICTSAVQHDLGMTVDEGWKEKRIRSPLDGSENPVEFAADKSLLASAEAVRLDAPVRAVRGLIATGDVFVASAAKKEELRTRCHADVVDMESGAVAQICWQQAVPFLAVRSPSDQAGSVAKSQLRQTFDQAVSNLATFVVKLIESRGREGR